LFGNKAKIHEDGDNSATVKLLSKSLDQDHDKEFLAAAKISYTAEVGGMVDSE
jgi:hypothetical protein